MKDMESRILYIIIIFMVIGMGGYASYVNNKLGLARGELKKMNQQHPYMPTAQPDYENLSSLIEQGGE